MPPPSGVSLSQKVEQALPVTFSSIPFLHSFDLGVRVKDVLGMVPCLSSYSASFSAIRAVAHFTFPACMSSLVSKLNTFREYEYVAGECELYDMVTSQD